MGAGKCLLIVVAVNFAVTVSVIVSVNVSDHLPVWCIVTVTVNGFVSVSLSQVSML